MLRKNIWKDFIVTGYAVNKSEAKELMRLFLYIYILNIMRYLIFGFEEGKNANLYIS